MWKCWGSWAKEKHPPDLGHGHMGEEFLLLKTTLKQQVDRRV
jgi:hypothetical protein